MNGLIKFVDFEYEYVDNFSFQKNGIQIIESIDKIEIYNDVFRTIPLFISKNEKNIIIFSNYNTFYDEIEFDKTIDKVGFWEIILFGFAIGTRTIFENVKQMTSASKIIINKKDYTYTIERYWDFKVDTDYSIKNIETASDELFMLLEKNFSNIPANTKYITGISGGMDSRITLAFLSKFLNNEKLELFTYGFNEKIYEYKYAKEIAKRLNYKIPKFHKLNKLTYLNSLNYMPKFTGGQIGINHSPLFSYLNVLENNDSTLIATSYSEIIFSLKTEKEYSNTQLSLEIKLNNATYINENIKNIIEEDIKKLKKEYNNNETFSNINDYLYLTEQHPKFHEYLTYLFKSKIKVFNPYTNFELLKYVLSIPKEFKYRKKLQDKLLIDYFKLKDKNVSSSRFEWGDAGSAIDWFKFKTLNKINAVLRLITKGHIQLVNPYQTEEQSRLLYQFFLKDLEKILNKLYDNNLLDQNAYKHYSKLPISGLEIIERYHILSLGEIINDK